MNTATFTRSPRAENYTDFSGLEYTAEQKKAMEAWAGRRLHPLENIDDGEINGPGAIAGICGLVAIIAIVAGFVWGCIKVGGLLWALL